MSLNESSFTEALVGGLEASLHSPLANPALVDPGVIVRLPFFELSSYLEAHGTLQLLVIGLMTLLSLAFF